MLSPRYPDSVFIFGPLVNDTLQPNGTCFIISDRYLLTAQHNMTKSTTGDSNTTTYGIALVVDVQEPPVEFHTVNIKYYNIEYNYAILELTGRPFSGDRVPIPITIDSDGGDEYIQHNTDFKIFHIPILDYNCQVINGISAYTAWGKIVNTYTRETHDDKHKRYIYGNINLYRGSSGTPFVLRNGSVFAMYVENKSCIPTDITITAMNKGVDASNVADSGDEDDNDSDISDISITYSDAPVFNKPRCRGLYFKHCPPLIEQLYELGILKQQPYTV